VLSRPTSQLDMPHECKMDETDEICFVYVNILYSEVGVVRIEQELLILNDVSVSIIVYYNACYCKTFGLSFVAFEFRDFVPKFIFAAFILAISTFSPSAQNTGIQ